MNNQVKLIDRNKILNNLMEYIETFNDDLGYAIKEGDEAHVNEISNKIELLQVFVDGIVSGSYKADTPPVPTIKPGDKVKYKPNSELGLGEVRGIDVYVKFEKYGLASRISPGDLEVVE